jgi:hypothetical protein
VKMNNQSGELVTMIAITLAVILGLVFIPNDASKTLGLQNKQNKIVQKQTSKERVELLKDDKGNIIATKTYTDDTSSDSDEQQHITLWERIIGLPFVLLILVIAGCVFIPGFGIALKKWLAEKLAHKKTVAETKKIIVGLDEAFGTIALTLAGEKLPGEVDRAALAERIKSGMLDVLSKRYDTATKDLVRSLRA